MTREQYKILRAINKAGSFQLKKDISKSRFEELKRLGYVELECIGKDANYFSQYSDTVLLTSAGKEAVEMYVRSSCSFVIAIFALVLSACSLLVDVAQWV